MWRGLKCHIQGRITVTDFGIILTNFTEDDAGIYTCTLSNQEGTCVSHFINSKKTESQTCPHSHPTVRYAFPLYSADKIGLIWNQLGKGLIYIFLRKCLKILMLRRGQGNSGFPKLVEKMVRGQKRRPGQLYENYY